MHCWRLDVHSPRERAGAHPAGCSAGDDRPTGSNLDTSRSLTGTFDCDGSPLLHSTRVGKRQAGCSGHAETCRTLRTRGGSVPHQRACCRKTRARSHPLRLSETLSWLHEPGGCEGSTASVEQALHLVSAHRSSGHTALPEAGCAKPVVLRHAGSHGPLLRTLRLRHAGKRSWTALPRQDMGKALGTDDGFSLDKASRSWRGSSTNPEGRCTANRRWRCW
mmetsp:Transcript_107914/g.187322  ORF Transcript_107914/g.187322 Transcript_107914/m.187322 type:complete len:220 (+) Transcript_107914:2270-2929(+)